MAAETDPLAYVPVVLALGKMYTHWAGLFVKQYMTGELNSGVNIWNYWSSTGDGTVTPSQQAANNDPTDDTDTMWEIATTHDDLILTLLVGLFVLLLLVRYVFVNTQRQERERARLRQEALARQLEREQQQENVQ
jgi:hypothetical protein